MKIHIVQKGDTLWKIAKKYGVDFEELKKMNAQLSNPDMIMPGMKIKVPASGTHVKKQKPHVPHGGHKEMPKEHHHHPPKVHKEVKKEVIKKEVPQKIYQPVMPQPLPEIDISNYYMMNMNQMQAQVQQQKEVEVKEEVPEMEVMPMPMPIQGGCPPMYPQYCCPPPVMPVCDPCYPYPMMPQVQGMMGYPQMPMGGYMPQMPMYSQMPAVMPAAEYGVMPQHWGDESSSSSSMEYHHHHHGHHHHGHHHHGHHHPHMAEEMDDPPPYTGMPMQGWSQPYGGYPMAPAYPQGQQMGMPYGTYGQQPLYEQPMGEGAPYPMMPRADEEEEDD
ncbi:SafA/ExsA family spore coat assembly protein [Siminovitchia fortis]|uniref:SafA/ExsA family spore coat assembly protein n=1 Tax=Siminovitchia fortis TaxID=254758 RepID=A0A443ITY4_9BACI|nr:SafA/ExsA family spore coat assembly protein [Siminovitchia fortis]RWR11159.1 SafA/ExsA family spore coat assembly protein [Siminovitchia fortis]WHY82514.1 SafA/ExsA family spore coat assembly protein [Siminovitchia fortis]